MGRFRLISDIVQCCRKVDNGRKVPDAIRSLGNARNLQLVCARVLHEALLIPVLLHGSEIMIWRKERSGIWVLQMENLRSLLGIK